MHHYDIEAYGSVCGGAWGISQYTEQGLHWSLSETYTELQSLQAIGTIFTSQNHQRAIEIPQEHKNNESCKKTTKLTGWKGSEVKVKVTGVNVWHAWKGLVTKYVCANIIGVAH